METYKTLRELFMTLCNTEVDTAVILGHINPDGDAVGSVMGVAYYLRENFPCPGPCQRGAELCGAGHDV